MLAVGGVCSKALLNWEDVEENRQNKNTGSRAIWTLNALAGAEERERRHSLPGSETKSRGGARNSVVTQRET